jgi:hypothetical protein
MLQDHSLPDRRMARSRLAFVSAVLLAGVAGCAGVSATADKQDSTGGALGTGMGTISSNKAVPTNASGAFTPSTGTAKP